MYRKKGEETTERPSSQERPRQQRLGGQTRGSTRGSRRGTGRGGAGGNPGLRYENREGSKSQHSLVHSTEQKDLLHPKKGGLKPEGLEKSELDRFFEFYYNTYLPSNPFPSDSLAHGHGHVTLITEIP